MCVCVFFIICIRNERIGCLNYSQTGALLCNMCCVHMLDAVCSLINDSFEQAFKSTAAHAPQTGTHNQQSNCAVLPTLFSVILVSWRVSLERIEHSTASLHIHAHAAAFPSSAKFSACCTSETNTLKEALEWNLVTSQEERGCGGGATWQNNRHVITLLAFQMTSSSAHVQFCFSP